MEEELAGHVLVADKEDSGRQDLVQSSIQVAPGPWLSLTRQDMCRDVLIDIAASRPSPTTCRRCRLSQAL
jgi:hypothetical protein